MDRKIKNLKEGDMIKISTRGGLLYSGKFCGTEKHTQHTILRMLMSDGDIKKFIADDIITINKL